MLLFFIFLSLTAFQPSNFSNFLEKGPEGILSATFLIFFAYAGFGKITAASEEVKNPEKTIPRAIITAVTVTMLLYILCGTAAVGAVGAEKLSQYKNAPLANVMIALGFEKAFLVVTIGALTATGSVLLIQMLSISRTIYAMSMNNQLPSFFSKIHPRFKSPYRAEIAIGILMAIATLFLNASSVIALTIFGILSYYSLINLAALVIGKQMGRFNIHPAVPTLGFLLSLFLIAYFFVFSRI